MTEGDPRVAPYEDKKEPEMVTVFHPPVIDTKRKKVEAVLILLLMIALFVLLYHTVQVSNSFNHVIMENANLTHNISQCTGWFTL